MRTLLFLITSSFFSTQYVIHSGKAYLLDEADLRIVTSEGSRRLPLFGAPVSVVLGSRPYVLTTQALFAIDPAGEEVSAVLRLDRAYSDALAGANERIWLLGGDELSVVEGSETKMSFLYSYGLPRLVSAMFLLPSGELFFAPAEGKKGFTYNPNTKTTADVVLFWTPREPIMVGSVLVDRDSLGLCFFNLADRKTGAVNLGARPKYLYPWRGKVLAATSTDLVLVDPGSSSVLARVKLGEARKLCAVDCEDFCTVLGGNDLVTLSLPALTILDTFNASCDARSSAYPFFGKPLFRCGDKLALPGGTVSTKAYLVQTLKPEEGSWFALQVGAFADPTSFGPLMELLARQGLPYYTLKEGEFTKFRIGFFHTRDEADRVRSFLPHLDSWIVTEKAPYQLVHSLHDLNHDVCPDGIVAKEDSVLVLTLRERTWIEVLKASKLPEPLTEVYLLANRAFAKLERSGVKELVLPDSTQ